MPAKKPPAGEAKPPKLVHLRLKMPIDGIVAGRIVTASEKTAARLKKDEQAELATKKMVSIAGGNIPHIHD